jgi:putative ABC transport system permease protein
VVAVERVRPRSRARGPARRNRHLDALPRAAVSARAEALPYVGDVAYRLTISGRHVAATGGASAHATLVGVRPGRRGYAILSGHAPTAPDEAVIEAGMARAWHVRRGDRIGVDGRMFRVAGVGLSPDTVAFPLAKGPRLWLRYDDVRKLAGAPPDSVNEALLWVTDRKRLDVTLSQARMASYGVSGLQFVTRAGIHALIGQAGGIVIALLVGFSVVALATAAAMLAAAAAGDVQRRLTSIGLLRAVGASRRNVALGFALEAALVALPAALVGLFVGWLIAAPPTTRLLDSLNELPPGWELLGLLALALVGIVLLVAAASSWPAWRAAARSPVEALRGADLAPIPRRAPVPPGPSGLGLRLALARPLRTAATVAVLAASAAVVLLILVVATVLARLHASPAAVGKRYELSVYAPSSATPTIRALRDVADATPRWSIEAADSFELNEPFTLVAYGDDPTRWESPPLAEGRRARADVEAEVGLGLAQALDLHPGATLAAQIAGGREIRFRVVGIDRVLQDEGRIVYVRPRRLLAAAGWANPSVAVKLEAGADGRAVERELERRGFFSASAGGVSGEAVQDWAGRNGGFVSILVGLLRTVALLDGLVCLYARTDARTDGAGAPTGGRGRARLRRERPAGGGAVRRVGAGRDPARAPRRRSGCFAPRGVVRHAAPRRRRQHDRGCRRRARRSGCEPRGGSVIVSADVCYLEHGPSVAVRWVTSHHPQSTSPRAINSRTRRKMKLVEALGVAGVDFPEDRSVVVVEVEVGTASSCSFTTASPSTGPTAAALGRGLDEESRDRRAREQQADQRVEGDLEPVRRFATFLSPRAQRLTASKVTEQLIGETARVGEREEMATWNVVDADVKPFLCDSTLELDRKEPIVASGDHVDRDCRPRLESAGLAEDHVGFGPLPRFSLLHDLWWKVV